MDARAETRGALADAIRRRVHARVLPTLGPRRVFVVGCGGAAPVEDGGPGAVVTVCIGDAAPGGGAARREVSGAVGRLPVQSESATGVLFHHLAPGDEGLREAARILQPGGAVLVADAGPVSGVEALDRSLRAAGFGRTSRHALFVPAAVADRAVPRLGAAFAISAALRRARRAEDGDVVEWIVSARLPGGTDVEIPTAGEVLSSIFLPARWRGGRGADEVEGPSR